MATATGQKFCVKCQKDVTHDKRMKDSQGRYWCIDCGNEDAKSKQQRVVCADCRGKYNASEMTDVGGESVCPGCVKARNRPGGAVAASPEQEGRKRVMKLAIGGVLLAVGAGLIAMSVFDKW